MVIRGGLQAARLGRGLSALIAVVDRYSLADIAVRKVDLRGLFGIIEPA